MQGAGDTVVSRDGPNLVGEDDFIQVMTLVNVKLQLCYGGKILKGYVIGDVTQLGGSGKLPLDRIPCPEVQKMSKN